MSGVVMFDSWEGVIILCIDMAEEFIVWYANEIVLTVVFYSRHPVERDGCAGSTCVHRG